MLLFITGTQFREIDLELDLRHAKVDVNDNVTLLDVICICNDPSLNMQGVTIAEEKARHTGLGLGLSCKRVHLSALNGPFTMRYWFSDQPCLLRPPTAESKAVFGKPGQMAEELCAKVYVTAGKIRQKYWVRN